MSFMPWMFHKTRWLMRFIARLLELKPELTPAAATMVAIEAFEESFDVDPARAAEIYVDGEGLKQYDGPVSRGSCARPVRACLATVHPHGSRLILESHGDVIEPVAVSRISRF
jgi:hypothetical protein